MLDYCLGVAFVGRSIQYDIKPISMQIKSWNHPSFKGAVLKTENLFDRSLALTPDA